MRTRMIYLICALTVAVFVVLFLATRTTSANPSAPLATVTWIDNFEGTSLDSRWSWIRQDPTHWSLTANPGFLRITTQTGSLRATANNQNNLLMALAPTGNFTVTTKVTIPVSQNKQNAGIFVYADDDNFVALLRIFNSGNWVSFGGEVGGTYSPLFTTEPASTVFLRIARQGSLYTGSYSSNGTDWTTVGQHSMSSANLKMGIGASNGETAGATEIAADFDFFRLDDSSNYLFLPVISR